MQRFASALVVDSDSISLRMVERMLRTFGIQRIATAHSLSAAAAHAAFPPELVVIEIVIAQEPCFPLLQTFSELPAPPTVLAMSKTASRAQVFRLSSFGVSAFLEKPVSTAALSRALSSAAQVAVAARDRPGASTRMWNASDLNAFIQSRGEAWRLTNTEMEILRYSCAGMSRQEIAAERGVTINTIKTHVRAILNKAGLNSIRLIVQQLSLLQLQGSAEQLRTEIQSAPQRPFAFAAHR